MKIKAIADRSRFGHKEKPMPCIIIGVDANNAICLFEDKTITWVTHGLVEVVDEEYLDLFKENWYGHLH